MESSQATHRPKGKRERVTEMVGVEVFARGEDTLACRLQASLTRLHGVCELHSATQSEVRTNHIDQKEKDKDSRKGCPYLFGRSVDLFTFGEDILLLRLTSELVDLRKEYANPILLRRVKFSSPTPTKKR